MTDAITAIDRALADLCPCGTPPREGSAYCSYDCEPSHVSIHTDSRETGDYATPMRWRPDLVTAHDDSELVPFAEPFTRGTYTAQTFQYRDSDRLHFRLDDGNRYVGLDVDGLHAPNEVFEQTWTRLERELTDQRRLDPDPDDPWAGAWGDTSVGLGGLNARHCVHCGEITEPIPGRRPVHEPVDIYAWGNTLPIMSTCTEMCDLCGNCRQAFIGPPLQVRSFGSLSPVVEVRLGDFGSRVVLPPAPASVRYCRVQAERELIDEYCRQNPEQPDVIEWIRARDAREDRLSQMRRRYLQQQRVSATLVNPRSFLRGITIT